MQSIWLCYACLSPIQTPPEPARSSSEDAGELLLKKPELQQVNKEGPKVQIFVADTFYFAVLMLLGTARALLPWAGWVSCRIPHLIGVLNWF